MFTFSVIVTIFFIFCFIVSFYHCYAKRGFRLAFNFFFFGSLYIARWVAKNLGGTPKELKTMRCAVFSFREMMCNIWDIFDPSTVHMIEVFFIQIMLICGWVFLFYIGWYLSEKIMQRFNMIRRDLFPTLLLSLLVISSIAYPVEAIGSSLGWWRWQLPDIAFDTFFIYCPSQPLRAEFYAALYFLAAYFLIECSRFKQVRWKMVFFILPFVHLFTIMFFGGGIPRLVERGIAVVVLVIGALFSRLKLEYTSDANSLQEKRTSKWLFLIVSGIWGVLISTVIVMTLSGKSLLFFALIPGLILYLFSIKKIPYVIIVFLGCVPFFVDKILALSSIAPIIVFFLLKMRDHLQGKRGGQC